MAERMPPNGEFRVVGVDELFFSTTDMKGVIEQANSVFARLSQFPRSELMGAPHNLIRHPDMPGGAFRVMWDLLLSGRPMGAYVKNLAKDGFTYWVFATITPIGDKLLSVRTAPCVGELWETVDSVYREVRPIELDLMRSGYNRHEAAEVGAAEIAKRVAGLGFPSYEDFIRFALPAEIGARVAQSQRNTNRPDITGGLGQLLGAVNQINAELFALMQRLDSFQELANALAKASADTITTIDGLRQASDMASIASDHVVNQAPVLSRAAQGMSTKSGEVSLTLETLADELDQVRSWILELRFRISLTRLHNDMVAAFVIEVADGMAPPEGLSYVPILCQALQEDVFVLNADMSNVAGTLRGVSAKVDEAGEQLREFQRGMSTWRLLVPKYQMSRQLDPYVAPIDQQLNQGHSQMAGLRDLARRCVAEAHPFDPGPTQSAISLVQHVASAILERTTG